MKPLIKAALLSAFVIPGAGQFSLKRPKRGMVFVGTTLMALYILTSAAMEKAEQISAKILSGEVPLDAATLSAMITASPPDSGTMMVNYATATLLITWVLAIVDALLGQKGNTGK